MGSCRGLGGMIGSSSEMESRGIMRSCGGHGG